MRRVQIARRADIEDLARGDLLALADRHVGDGLHHRGADPGLAVFAQIGGGCGLRRVPGWCGCQPERRQRGPGGQPALGLGQRRIGGFRGPDTGAVAGGADAGQAGCAARAQQRHEAPAIVVKGAARAGGVEQVDHRHRAHAQQHGIARDGAVAQHQPGDAIRVRGDAARRLAGDDLDPGGADARDQILGRGGGLGLFDHGGDGDARVDQLQRRQQRLGGRAQHDRAAAVQRIIEPCQHQRGAGTQHAGQVPAGKGQPHVAPATRHDGLIEADQVAALFLVHQPGDQTGHPAQIGLVREQPPAGGAQADVDPGLEQLDQIGPRLQHPFGHGVAVADRAAHPAAPDLRDAFPHHLEGHGMFVDQHHLRAALMGAAGGGDPGGAGAHDQDLGPLRDLKALACDGSGVCGHLASSGDCIAAGSSLV